ncbi:MAG: hypothetical protein IPP76_06380 [Moraxellaceae bacterium]|nr:hypothetical protein [Moraxellaceae bacterium]
MKKIDLVKPLTDSALLLAAGASQAAIDVTAATGALVTDGTSAISAVGLALITLAGIAVVFKWVKAAFF